MAVSNVVSLLNNTTYSAGSFWTVSEPTFAIPFTTIFTCLSSQNVVFPELVDEGNGHMEMAVTEATRKKNVVRKIMTAD
jgi:hypothetical protein